MFITAITPFLSASATLCSIGRLDLTTRIESNTFEALPVAIAVMLFVMNDEGLPTVE